MDDGVDIGRFNISPLSPHNYFVWSSRLELILRSKNLWPIVCGDEKETGQEDQELFERFEKRKNAALMYIILTIEDECVAPVLTEKDPARAWNRLRDLYAASSRAHVEALQSELNKIRMMASESVHDYGNRIKTLSNQLSAVGEMIEDEELVSFFLGGLPSKFQMQSLVTRQFAKTLDDAVSQIAAEEVRQRHSRFY